MQWIAIGIAVIAALAALMWGWPLLLAAGGLYYLYTIHQARPTDQRTRNVLLGVGAVLLLVAVPIQVVWITSGPLSDSPEADSPSATGRAQMTGRVDSISVVDSATVLVTGTVTNEGDAAGAPSCSVTVDDSSGANYGVEAWYQDAELAPGQSTDFSGTITVTNNGAASATRSRVDC